LRAHDGGKSLEKRIKEVPIGSKDLIHQAVKKSIN